MTKDALYTLDELAGAANITPRTIRFYTSEGVLAGPQSRGRFALYGMGHLARLRLIALLKAALMPLAQMREHLPLLTDAQVTALLTQAGVTGSVVEQWGSEAAFALDADVVGTPVGEQDAAYHALSKALRARQQTSESDANQTPAGQAQTDAMQTPAASLSDRKTRRALLVSSRLSLPDKPQDNAEAESADGFGTIENRKSEIENPDTWQRILLAPGVELHVRTPDSPRGREQLDRAIAHAKSLFQP